MFFQVYLYLSVDVGPIRLSCIPAMNVFKARYSVFLQVSGQCFKFLLRKPSVELAFLVLYPPIA